MTTPLSPPASTDPSDLPVVRLLPKANARAIRHGAPWVFDNELVTDRRTKAIAPGSLAVLEDAGREPMALVAVTPGSRIAGRVLDAPGVTALDQGWFRARLTRALALRERLFDQGHTGFYQCRDKAWQLVLPEALIPVDAKPGVGPCVPNGPHAVDVQIEIARQLDLDRSCMIIGPRFVRHGVGTVSAQREGGPQWLWLVQPCERPDRFVGLLCLQLP